MKLSNLLGLCIFASMSIPGCTAARHEARAPSPVDPAGGIVYFADGAGNFYSATDSLTEAVQEAALPLRVEPVAWSHGYGRVLSDQFDYENVRAEGCRLAARVTLQKHAFPEAKVHLMGHSAGCAVILAAAEQLPPGSVEHVVLLAPAVARDYDLRPTLSCARRGIDVFYSEWDVGFLGLITGVVGTTDRAWAPAAGRVGFRPVVCAAVDSELHAQLRQHPWHPVARWTGHRGGHYGVYGACHLQAYVLPILMN